MSAQADFPEPSASVTACHICIVTETWPPEINGVAMTLAHLAQGLRAKGHYLSIVRPRQGAADTNSDCETLARGCPLPGYPGLQCGLPAPRKLLRIWARRRPAAVYVATEGPLGWSAVSAARRLRLPVLTGFHTNYHSYARHYRIAPLQRAVFCYLRTLHNRSDITLAPESELRRALEANGFRNVHVLGRGVDRDLFTHNRRSPELRLSWGVGNQAPAVLYVGRLASEKNFTLALEAYRAMERVNRRAKFVVAGDGPLRAALERANPDLIFTGLLTGERLAQHYASADIFLFPSETETFGNVTLEAMASGLAIVAYGYAAARAHLVSGESAMLAPYRDRVAFVGAAVTLASDPQLIARLGEQASRRAAALDWACIIDRFEQLLIAARHRSRTAPSRGQTFEPITIAAKGET